MDRIRRCARCVGIPVCVDGLSTYVQVFCRRFKEPVPGGTHGMTRLSPRFLLAQVIKSRKGCRFAGVAQRVVIGTLEAVQ